MGKPNAHVQAVADARRRLVHANLELDVAKANVKVCKAALEVAVLDCSIEVERQPELTVDEIREAREKAKERAAGS